MMKRSVVCLSSGLDSTVNLYFAKRESNVALALTFNYGQRAALMEIKNSKRICELLGVRHHVLDISWLGQITHTSLVNEKVDVPLPKDIDDTKEMAETAKQVWVPNRNGVFLNIAASFAESLECDWVVPGFNKEEAATFPDNSEDYLKSLNHAFSFSTQNQVEVKCFTTRMNKSEIVQKGRELGVNFDLVWPCYFGYDKPCGECESCKRFQRAMSI